MNLFELFVKIGVDDQASGKLSKLTGSLGKGLATAAKIGTAAVGAAATAITALTTAAVNNYAEYEQLVGGVETLFSKSESAADSFADSIKNDVEAIKEFQRANNLAVDGILGPQTMSAIESKFGEMQSVSKEGAETVIKNAANAYKTAGLSANEYMETVTSFSASLIQSLGGDTEEAAEYADRAIVSMSDNANKMGTSMEMIQNAYQGFAKQNYTMLDNLKLGYGGTKTEMERLIEDASKMTDVQERLGITVDASSMSFDNIVNAIQVVQENMGIAGATALEAGTTIEGSVNSMKAAWQNLLTGLADGNADIETLVENLVTTIVGDGTESNLGVLGNIMPAVKTALKGAASVVAQSAPIIAEELPKLMEEILPDLASATANLIVALAEQIPSMAQTLVDAAFQIVDEIGNAFSEKIPGLSVIFENLETVIISLTAAFGAYKLAMAISGIIDTLRKATEGQTLAQTLLNAVMNANPFVLVATLIAGLVAAIITLWNTNEEFREAVSNIWGEIQDLFSEAWKFIKKIWSEVSPYFEAIWKDIRSTFSVVTKILGGFFSAAWSAIKSVWSVVSSYFSTVWNTIKGIFSVVKSVLSGNFSDAWEAIKGIFDGWAEFFEGLWDDLTGVFSDVWDWFSELGGEIVDGIKSGISAAWEGLKEWFNGIWSSLFGNRTANITVNKNVNTIHGGGGGKIGSVDGSHASGLDYVPFDGYIAELHKGERVLTAKEAKKYPVGTNFNGDINIIVQGDKYRDENALADAIAERLQMMTDRRAAVYA